jgi:hypothetical protein
VGRKGQVPKRRGKNILGVAGWISGVIENFFKKV